MNASQLTDLKQFVLATVSQSEQRIKSEIKMDIDSRISRLEQKMDDGFAGVAEAIDRIHGITDDLVRRVTRLEQRPA